MTGAITSDSELEIERAVWRLRCVEARRNREPLPKRPRRIKGGDPSIPIPPDLCVGVGGRAVARGPRIAA